MFTVIILYGRYILAIVVIAFLLFGCRMTGYIQAELTTVKLERIEIKYRYPDYVAWLRWRDINRNEFETEIPIEDTSKFRVGMYMAAVMRR